MKDRDFILPAGQAETGPVEHLGGCETLSEVNVKLRGETDWPGMWRWERFADQSSLSRTLDALTLKHIDQLRTATTHLAFHESNLQHDWRGYLLLDFDLSGLPCKNRLKKAKKAISVVKKHDRSPIGTGQLHQVSRNDLVRAVSRQSTYGPLPATSGVSPENALELAPANANGPSGAWMAGLELMNNCAGCWREVTRS